MAPPSQLTVATLSVTRLLKEEISYEKELIQQRGKVTTLENEIKEGKPDEDGNREYMLKQLVSHSPISSQYLWSSGSSRHQEFS